MFLEAHDDLISFPNLRGILLASYVILNNDNEPFTYNCRTFTYFARNLLSEAPGSAGPGTPPLTVKVV